MPTNLPLPDYDQLTPSAITVRLRALGIQGVVALLDHEQHHAARPTVCQILEHRIDTLRERAAARASDASQSPRSDTRSGAP